MVGTLNRAFVYLRDVATVVDVVEERLRKNYNNGVQGAMIVVQKQSGANSVNISKKVMDQLPIGARVIIGAGTNGKMAEKI